MVSLKATTNIAWIFCRKNARLLPSSFFGDLTHKQFGKETENTGCIEQGIKA